MSVQPNLPAYGQCPFCGVATDVPHETQEGCIAALHVEIGRVRGILATLTPTGGPRSAGRDDEPPIPARLALE